jgi:hypothetical protein|tara:strand:- start:763 stop:987 length:225 start_codon:yes stop_codon:yes gene_type:complete
MNLRSKPLYRAALARFEAQKLEALATIEIYLNNSVGIGEHSNILDEVEKHTSVLADAEEKISILKAHFGGRSEK